MQVFPGKIRWFSQEQRHGVVIGIGGESLFFTCPPADGRASAAFTEGQLVGYSELGHSRIGPRAGDVHGLGRRSCARPALELVSVPDLVPAS